MLILSSRAGIRAHLWWVILAFVVAPISADEFSLAMDAMSAKNYRDSASRWKKLSRQGSIVAEYNLAISLQRIPGRAGTHRSWLKAAARDKLITAYQRLQPGAVRPVRMQQSLRGQKWSGHVANKARVTPPVESKDVTADKWVRQLDPGYYTLQIASSPNRASMENFYRDNQLQRRAGLYKSWHQDEHRYTLIYGAYPTANKARSAISTLPQQLQKWKPWAKSIKQIHRVMLPLEPSE